MRTFFTRRRRDDGSPTLQHTADRLRSEFRRHDLPPDFDARLRAEIAREVAARRALPSAPQRPDVERVRRPSDFSRRRLVLPGAVIAMGAAAVLIVSPLGRGVALPAPSVRVTAAISGQTALDPQTPIRLHFSGAVDHAGVMSALRVQPAARLAPTWTGDDLMLRTVNGLASNTAYTLDLNPAGVRDYKGAPLAAGLHAAFGTIATGNNLPQPAARTQPLTAQTVLPADDGSEAVILGNGTLLATAGHLGSAPPQLLRMAPGEGAQPLAAATSAICVSQSGRSVAYLAGSGTTAKIVMAGSDGRQLRGYPVTVDAGSPLGWIGDEEVSFVGSGLLHAVDRDGGVRTFPTGRIDASHDAVDIAPGGRYVFIRAQGAARAGDGAVIDLVGKTTTDLHGIVGDPTFSIDGATVAWLDASAGPARLDMEPSSGGVRRQVSLPLAPGDQAGNLALSPDGTRLLYVVRHGAGSADTRLAETSTGATVATASGTADSPNWAPEGDRVAVLAGAGTPASHIAVLGAPSEAARGSQLAAMLALTVADAQIGGDAAALRILAPAADVSRLPRATRAGVMSVTAAGGGSVVDLRLVLDADATHPAPRVAHEKVLVNPASGSGRPAVSSVIAEAFTSIPVGPHVTAAGFDPDKHVIRVDVDSDVDAATVDGAVVVLGQDGHRVAATTSYDAAHHRLLVVTAALGTVDVTLGPSLRDSNGQPVTSPMAVSVSLA